jgi:hypothetical protein
MLEGCDETTYWMELPHQTTMVNFQTWEEIFYINHSQWSCQKITDTRLLQVKLPETPPNQAHPTVYP